MSICLFGGTFDPPHIGHLIIADYVISNLEIEKILFVPASIPPHKPIDAYSPAAMRIEMLQLALRDTPAFGISTAEINRIGVSYSVDTIRQFQKEMNLSKEDTYFLIGSDNLIEFNNWKDPMEILSLARVIVAPRPSFTDDMIQKEFLLHVRFLDCPQMNVSSSMIRNRVREGKSIRYLVTPEVLNYIQINRLYLLH